MKEHINKFLIPEFLLGLSFFQKIEPAPVDIVLLLGMVLWGNKLAKNLTYVFLAALLFIPTAIFDFSREFINIKWILTDILMMVYLVDTYTKKREITEFNVLVFLLGLLIAIVFAVPYGQLFLGFRLKLGMQDPNVLSAQSLLSFVLINEFAIKSRLRNLALLILALLTFWSYSRSAVAMLLFYLLLSSKSPINKVYLSTVLILVLLKINDVLPSNLNRFGLQAYDNDRWHYQWLALTEIPLSLPFGYSQGEFDAHNQHSIHNTFLRIALEQGLFSLLTFTAYFIPFIVYRRVLIFGLLLVLGLFVDMLHWRVLFIFLGFYFSSDFYVSIPFTRRHQWRRGGLE